MFSHEFIIFIILRCNLNYKVFLSLFCNKRSLKGLENASFSYGVRGKYQNIKKANETSETTPTIFFHKLDDHHARRNTINVYHANKIRYDAFQWGCYIDLYSQKWEWKKAASLLSSAQKLSAYMTL